MRLDHITPKWFGVLGNTSDQNQVESQTDIESNSFQIVKVLPGGHSEREPPDPIPNSEVKPLSADGSVGVPM